MCKWRKVWTTKKCRSTLVKRGGKRDEGESNKNENLIEGRMKIKVPSYGAQIKLRPQTKNPQLLAYARTG